MPTAKQYRKYRRKSAKAKSKYTPRKISYNTIRQIAAKVVYKKADVNKHAKQYNDINFRNHYQLERYYTTNDHFQEYIDQAVNPEHIDEVIDELHSDLSC